MAIQLCQLFLCVVWSYMESYSHKWSCQSFLSSFKLTPDQDQKSIKKPFISSWGDSLSEKIDQVEQVPLMRRQLVRENQSSGTSSPDKETACLRKPIKRINYHLCSPAVFYSQMSTISMKETKDVWCTNSIV